MGCSQTTGAALLVSLGHSSLHNLDLFLFYILFFLLFPVFPGGDHCDTRSWDNEERGILIQCMINLPVY